MLSASSTDRRGPLAKTGPKYLRWALIEAATHAARSERYRVQYERNQAHEKRSSIHKPSATCERS